MKKRSVISCIMSLILVVALVSTTVFASGFNDVDNDPTVSWAKDTIADMTKAGYIKGYEDGTFKPYRAISKIECLLLMSRILGVDEADYKDVAKEAVSMYETVVRKHNTTYVKELCYLMYMGILSENDLVNYASATSANTELLRQQAAKLMAQMMGAETKGKEFTVDKATYADNSKISVDFRSYVEFVTEEKIMNGMDADAAGNPQFSPLTSLTRAQMATLLSRMTDKIDKMIYVGIIDELDLDNDTIMIDRDGDVNDRIVNADTVARFEREEIDLDKLEVGMEISVVELEGHIQLIEVLGKGEGIGKEDADKTTKDENTTIYAKIVSTSENKDGKKITLADTENSTNTATYDVSDDCEFRNNNQKINFSNLEKNKIVKVVFSSSEIILISIEKSDFTIKGELIEVEYDEDNVYIAVDNNGKEEKYIVSSSGATVKRGGKRVEYRDLSVGDAVTLTIKAGKVTAVTATGSSEQITGALTQIVIAQQPSVVMMVDGSEKTYKVRSDAKIYVANAEATIYDLRPNTTVRVTLDSSEVKTIEASSSSSVASGLLSATVTAINTSYKVITAKDDDGNTQSIYYNTETKFLKESGAAASSKDVSKGSRIDVRGVNNNGVFEATIIIIN